MTPSTIADLEALGYTLGIAHGSVQVEEDALAAARQAASAGVVIEQAGQIGAATLQDLANAGNLPTDPAAKAELAAQIGAAALDMVSTHANEKVDFHTRAVAEAKAMADVWCVQQTVDGTVIFQTYVSTRADGTGWDAGADDALTALANPDAFAERDYQARSPEAMQAMRFLASRGRVCARPEPGADTFDVDGATYSGADLVALAEQVAAEPPPPTTAERFAAALESVPELSDASKQALLDALTEEPPPAA